LIERLVGHFTFAGLLQRGFLSVFQACYAFIRKHYLVEVELWPEVRRELFWAASLICLIDKDLGIPWSGRVHATNASFWGRGVVSIDRNVADVKTVGQHCDKWRFSPIQEKEVIRTFASEPMQDIDVETLARKADGCEAWPSPGGFPRGASGFFAG
jgi:hypothetical protein